MKKIQTFSALNITILDASLLPVAFNNSLLIPVTSPQQNTDDHL
jgi:hypothetical protein